MRAWGNFPPFSFIPPCEEIRVAAPRCFPPSARPPGGFVLALVYQTLTLIHSGPGAVPLPEFTGQPHPPSPGGRAPPAWVICPAQGGCARGGHPARPYLRGQRGARAPRQPPRSRRPHPPASLLQSQNHHKHPAPLAGAEQLVGSDTSLRVPAAALTQSGQQEGLAPFLRLGPLFVAGPEQGLQTGPGQRALHLPHGKRQPGAQPARATGEH